jgi:hypothetical protein
MIVILGSRQASGAVAESLFFFLFSFSFLLKKLYNIFSVQIQMVETGTQRNPCTQSQSHAQTFFCIVLEMFCPCISVFIITKRKKRHRTLVHCFPACFQSNHLMGVFLHASIWTYQDTLFFKGLPACGWKLGVLSSILHKGLSSKKTLSM